MTDELRAIIIEYADANDHMREVVERGDSIVAMRAATNRSRLAIQRMLAAARSVRDDA